MRANDCPAFGDCEQQCPKDRPHECPLFDECGEAADDMYEALVAGYADEWWGYE